MISKIFCLWASGLGRQLCDDSALSHGRRPLYHHPSTQFLFDKAINVIEVDSDNYAGITDGSKNVLLK